MKNKKFKFGITNLFSNNTFVIIFSVICSIIIWFSLVASNSTERPRIIYDVPISFVDSDIVDTENIQIFYQSDTTADVSVTGSVINQIGTDDILVSANFSPNISKLSGNTMVTETLTLTASKMGNSLADYQVGEVEPTEITIMYDRYSEQTFDITTNVSYSVGEDYYAAAPTYSNTSVTVSGPESSVNSIGKIALEYTISESLTSSKEFTQTLVVYDTSNQVMDLDKYYLTLSISSVDVSIEVLSKQTVELEVTMLNLPEGFSTSRITIEPSTIDIAGDYSVVSSYKSITLPTAVDFSNIDLENNTYTMTIPMPEGATNISNVSEATVTVNLTSFEELTINTTNFTIINVPDDKEVTLINQSLSVEVVGSPAQTSNLTSDSIYGVIDMANQTSQNGNKEVNVTIYISGASSCWVCGQYTIQVNIADAASETE